MLDVMTTSEVAKWLKVHPSTIYRLLRRREIPAFRVGSDWRILRADLVQWMEKITVMGRPDQPSSP